MEVPQGTKYIGKYIGKSVFRSQWITARWFCMLHVLEIL